MNYNLNATGGPVTGTAAVLMYAGERVVPLDAGERPVRSDAEWAAAAERCVGAASSAARPSQRRHAQDTDAPTLARVARAFEMRAQSGGGKLTVGGYACVTERGYEMWDAFGPYSEVVALTAFDKTLAANPMVEFTLNHGAGGGLPMASTRSGSLILEAVKSGDETGLKWDATVNPARSDVSDMVMAMEDGDLAEASFKFRIVSGMWSPDWTQYRIEEVDIDRGDVSACNFGANPHASSGVRADNKIAANTTAKAVEIAAGDTARRVPIFDADTRRRTA